MNLDRPVQIIRSQLIDDGFSMIEDWADHGPVHMAHKRDISDSERWRAGEVAATVTTRFTLRWSPFTADIDPRDRIECEGLMYDIHGVKESAGRRQWIEITASARNDLD